MAGNAVEVLADEHRKLEDLFDRVSSPDEDRPEVLKQVMQMLSTHVAAEEQMLIPVLRQQVPGGDDMAAKLDDERARVEEIMTSLERRKVNSPDVVGLVNDLIDITSSHIADAESSVFPALEESLSAEELNRLGQDLASDERRKLTHSHPWLPDRGPMAGAATKVAEVVDHLRDRSPDINRTTS